MIWQRFSGYRAKTAKCQPRCSGSSVRRVPASHLPDKQRCSWRCGGFPSLNYGKQEQVDDIGVLAGFNITIKSEFWTLSLDIPPSPSSQAISSAAPPRRRISVSCVDFLLSKCHCFPAPSAAALTSPAPPPLTVPFPDCRVATCSLPWQPRRCQVQVACKKIPTRTGKKYQRPSWLVSERSVPWRGERSRTCRWFREGSQGWVAATWSNFDAASSSQGRLIQKFNEFTASFWKRALLIAHLMQHEVDEGGDLAAAQLNIGRTAALKVAHRRGPIGQHRAAFSS